MEISNTSHRTARLVLRQLVEGDRAAFVRMHTVSAEHLRPWSPSLAADISLDQLFDERLERAARTAADGTGVRFAAFKVDAEGTRAGRPCHLVGMFSLNNIVRGVFQNADAGWLVNAEFVGQGFATEGVIGLLDVAFMSPPHGLGLHRVQANVIPGNVRSLRVARKAGFREEGLAKKLLEINGQWQDHVMFAKLAEEHGGE